jgi:hypothetical protein
VPLTDFTLQITSALRIVIAFRTRMRLPSLVRFEFDQIAPVVAICLSWFSDAGAASAGDGAWASAIDAGEEA